MEFHITIAFQGKKYRYYVAHVHRTLGFDFYHVVANNKKIVLRNNAPALSRKGITSRPVWTVEEGQVSNEEFMIQIIEAVNSYIMDQGRK